MFTKPKICNNFNLLTQLLIRRRLGKMQVNLLFRSPCTNFNLLTQLEIRLRLGYAKSQPCSVKKMQALSLLSFVEIWHFARLALILHKILINNENYD